MTRSPDGGGAPERRIFFQLDAAGQAVTADIDYDGDGLTDEHCTYSSPCAPPFAGCEGEWCEEFWEEQPPWPGGAEAVAP